jgi:hypothetical protein
LLRADPPDCESVPPAVTSFPELKYKNNIFLKPKCLSCSKNGGAGALYFLIEHFSVFGFDGQYWMLLVVALVAGFVLFVLATRNRN